MVFVWPDSSVTRVSTGESGMPVKAMRTAALFTGRSPKEEVTMIFRLPVERALILRLSAEGSLAADRLKEGLRNGVSRFGMTFVPGIFSLYGMLLFRESEPWEND